MRSTRQFFTRLAAALGWHRSDADLHAEIQTHLDALADELAERAARDQGFQRRNSST